MTIIVDMKDPEKIIGFVKRNWAHIVGWGLLALLYYPILRQLYTARWKNIDYEHAYFILPISIFLVWRLRKELAGVYSAAKEKISYLFLSIFVLGIAMYVFGWKWDYLFICAISLIPVSFAMTGFIYGWEVVKKIWFSFFYLIFMVPPPAAVLDNLTLPMRYISSHIAYGILKVAGYAPVKEGLVLTIGNFSALVGAECSGFRSFITLTALGLLYIYLYASKERLTYKAVLIGLIPFLAIIGNSFRICLISLLGYYFGEAVAEGPLHYGSGYLVYVFMIIGLFAADRLMSAVMHRASK